MYGCFNIIQYDEEMRNLSRYMCPETALGNVERKVDTLNRHIAEITLEVNESAEAQYLRNKRRYFPDFKTAKAEKHNSEGWRHEKEVFQFKNNGSPLEVIE